MPESQNIEYKETWRDEYLKWICGFANATGGSLFIGKNDKGNTVGIKNSKKLMDKIPNKVKDILGIIVDVNLKEEKEGGVIEIITEAYPFPVNYKGQYHIRSGSTKQELKGAALDRFLLERKGKKWDSVPVPKVTLSDLKQETFDFFRTQALKNKRITEEVLQDTNHELIESLQLSDNDFLKRATVLLFHPVPEKYVTGCYVKIGYFESDDDLKYQDEVHGNLFEQIEKTMDLLFSKYIKAEISYEGVTRVETYEYPKEAVREALLNAIAHKDYSEDTPIQISVYNDKIMFWNEGQLPENWTIGNLLTKHPSKPYNPDIANTLFRSGYIESWGRGTLKIVKQCEEIGLPKPEFHYDMSGFIVVFRKDFSDEYLINLGLNQRQIKAFFFVKENGKITNSEYQKINNCSRNTASVELNELVSKELFISSGQKGAGSYYEIKPIAQ